MKRLFALAVAGFILAACATQPVYNVENRAIPVQAQKLSLQQVEKAIVDAGTKRAWIMKSEGPGKLSAVQNNGKHVANIVITFDQKAFSIREAGTSNIRREEDKIHPRYNSWIHNLENDIQASLAAAAI